MVGTSQRRAAALLQVLGIYLAGPVLMLGVRRLFGISLPNPLNQLTAHATGAELVTDSRQLLALLVFQNSGYFAIFGLVFAWTRSLIPAMVAHAVFVIPLSAAWQSVLLAGLVIGAALVWRRAIAIIKQIFSTGSGTAAVALGILGAAYTALTSADRVIVYLVVSAYGLLLFGIVLQARDRSQSRAAQAVGARS